MLDAGVTVIHAIPRKRGVCSGGLARYARRYEDFVFALVATVSVLCWPWAFCCDLPPTTTADNAGIARAKPLAKVG